MPDYYGTGRQPKLKSSYVGLAITLLIVLLAVSIVPFVIPRVLQKQAPPERATPPGDSAPQQRSLVRSGDAASKEQATACGMLICELDEVQQRYWDLPGGVIVSQVDEGSAAARAGILPGDVILRIGGEAADSVATCGTLLAACSDGEQVQVVLYRCGEEIEIALPAATADGK